ncbi:MAG: hypothetical protein RTU63_13605, partial [Candidatus Thorarchaeota archaeon]
MSNLTFNRIEEYIFAPFNTFVYIDEDKLIFSQTEDIRRKLIDELNRESTHLEFRGQAIEWCLEDSEDFKLSKGVFSPPGTENSFVMAKVVDKKALDNPVPITEDVCKEFPADCLAYDQVRFYFQDCGVGTCSIRVDLNRDDGITILQLEQA